VLGETDGISQDGAGRLAARLRRARAPADAGTARSRMLELDSVSLGGLIN